MSCYVYVLRSEKTKALYIGLTKDLDRRIKEHDAGRCVSTRKKRPWKMIYKEEQGSYLHARQREKFYKTGRGREVLKKLIS